VLRGVCSPLAAKRDYPLEQHQLSYAILVLYQEIGAR